MPKRLLGGGEEREEGCNGSSSAHHQNKKQKPTLSTFKEMTQLQSMEAFPLVVESFLRKVVRDEAEKAVFDCFSPRTSIKFTAPIARPWRLQFMNKLPRTLFSGSRILADDQSYVQIKIVDCISNMIITYGSLASVKVKILVINGEFRADEETVWTKEEFTNNLVHERDGKRPLLTGDLIVSLKDGVGCFRDICFTDNSSWIRSRQFRLGVEAQCNLFEDVQEAVSGPFLVKDHRGELYKKHYPPSLEDEVWRLKKIGKDGVFHRRLAEKGISTVRDFLQLLTVNQEKLRNILGTGMTNKMWIAITDHAKECCIDNKIYTYTYNQHIKLHLNPIFELMGVQFGSDYQQFGDLAAQQKVFANELREFIYENQKDALNNPELTSRDLKLAGSTYCTTLVPGHQEEPIANSPSRSLLMTAEVRENPNPLKNSSGSERFKPCLPATILSESQGMEHIQLGEFQHLPCQVLDEVGMQALPSNNSASANLNLQGSWMHGMEQFKFLTTESIISSHRFVSDPWLPPNGNPVYPSETCFENPPDFPAHKNVY